MGFAALCGSIGSSLFARSPGRLAARPARVDPVAAFSQYCRYGFGDVDGLWWTEAGAGRLYRFVLRRDGHWTDGYGLRMFRYEVESSLTRQSMDRLATRGVDHLARGQEAIKCGESIFVDDMAGAIAARVLRGIASRPGAEFDPSAEDVGACARTLEPAVAAFRASIGPLGAAILTGRTPIGVAGEVDELLDSHWNAIVDKKFYAGFFEALERYPEHAAGVMSLKGKSSNWRFARYPVDKIAYAAFAQYLFPSFVNPGCGAPDPDRYRAFQSVARRVLEASRVIREAVEGMRAQGEGPGRDYMKDVAIVLSRLPPDWSPKGVGEWSAFLVLAPALREALSSVRGGAEVGFVASRGRWADLLARATKAAGARRRTPALRGEVDRGPGARLREPGAEAPAPSVSSAAVSLGFLRRERRTARPAGAVRRQVLRG